MARSAADSVSPFEIHRFGSDLELAAAVAERWVSEVSSRGPERAYCVALSGGRIAERFFGAVVDRCLRSSCSLESVRFFWADERCVPPEDPASNFRVAREMLLAPLKVGSERIFRIQGEVGKEQAAGLAIQALRGVVSFNKAEQPVFDMIFLGMGEDGHVASLFPEEPDTFRGSSETYRAVSAVKPPPSRVTLGYPAIAAAEKVWVLASGKGKEEALAKSLQGKESTPLGRVLRMRSETLLFTDIPETSGGG